MYRDLAFHNFEVLSQLPTLQFSRVVVFDPPSARLAVRRWLKWAGPIWTQCDGDLGTRLCRAFEEAFLKGAAKVMALGSDTLGLTPRTVEEAARALERHDVVLGPARDGGYYLIGLTRPQPALFENVPWSTSGVFDATQCKVRALGLTCKTVRTLDDLDEARFGGHVPQGCCG